MPRGRGLRRRGGRGAGETRERGPAALVCPCGRPVGSAALRGPEPRRHGCPGRLCARRRGPALRRVLAAPRPAVGRRPRPRAGESFPALPPFSRSEPSRPARWRTPEHLYPRTAVFPGAHSPSLAHPRSFSVRAALRPASTSRRVGRLWSLKELPLWGRRTSTRQAVAA